MVSPKELLLFVPPREHEEGEQGAKHDRDQAGAEPAVCWFGQDRVRSGERFVGMLWTTPAALATWLSAVVARSGFRVAW